MNKTVLFFLIVIFFFLQAKSDDTHHKRSKNSSDTQATILVKNPTVEMKSKLIYQADSLKINNDQVTLYYGLSKKEVILNLDEIKSIKNKVPANNLLIGGALGTVAGFIGAEIIDGLYKQEEKWDYSGQFPKKTAEAKEISNGTYYTIIGCGTLIGLLIGGMNNYSWNIIYSDEKPSNEKKSDKITINTNYSVNRITLSIYF